MIYLCYGEYQGRNLKAFYNYVIARVEQDNKDMSYKVYVSDLLKALAESTKRIQVSDRWYDHISGNSAKNEAEEAIENFFSDMRR